MLGRRIFIDVWITAFMSLTLVFFALGERYPERRRLFLVLMYVAAGLGMLTKGPVAVVLPGLAFLLYLLLRRELRRVREMMLPLGAVIVALIVVPWYAALYHDAWLGVHPLVHRQRESRAVHVRVRRPPGPQPVVLYPRHLRRFVSAVAGAGCRRGRRVA